MQPPAIAPASSVRPSIIDASHSTMPSAFRTEPRPAIVDPARGQRIRQRCNPPSGLEQGRDIELPAEGQASMEELLFAVSRPQENLHDCVDAICTHDYAKLRNVGAYLFAETVFLSRNILIIHVNDWIGSGGPLHRKTHYPASSVLLQAAGGVKASPRTSWRYHVRKTYLSVARGAHSLHV